MKVLVTGANGQLGHDLMRHLPAWGVECRGIDIKNLDLTDRDVTPAYQMEYAPDVVMHCAAYTAVDRAEVEPEVCRSINADATRTIAEACMALDAVMVYISTDYVFDGEGDAPYEIDAARGPRSVYEATKAEGEDEMTENLQKFFLVRVSWVFGLNGKNLCASCCD